MHWFVTWYGNKECPELNHISNEHGDRDTIQPEHKQNASHLRYVLISTNLASLLPIHTFFSNTEYVSNCLAGDLVGIWNSYVLMIS
jgi:hypothetical protein